MGYSYTQVLEASEKYFKGDYFAAEAFVNKYALQSNDGEFMELTPEDMHKRLAKELARIEKKYPNPLTEEEIFSLMDRFKYIVPQGSPMSAIGNNYQIQSVSNCFVIQGVHSHKFDSYGGIMMADQELAQIMKRRGGVGLDISGIRPKDAPTNNAAKTTDGIAIFMERFSNTCREVAQNGRRGAEMQTISVNHPEILTFIKIKRNLKKVTGANISIKITDEFMQAVKGNTDFTLRWPVEARPEDAKITRVVKAKEIWDEIIYSAWFSAEPGVLFWDTVTRNTPSDCYADDGFTSISTNPCGEIILSAYSSCKLLVLNLSSYVNNPFMKNSFFDYDLFIKHAIVAQRLMDDIIDLEIEQIDKIITKIAQDKEPNDVKLTELNLWKKIRQADLNGRRTGLGITALGDTIAMLGMKYGDKDSIALTQKIYESLAMGSHTSSCILAKERGAFLVFDYEKEKNHPYLVSIMKKCGPEVMEMWKTTGRRNIANTTTAPTGTTSAMTQTTAGIEPVFLLELKRRRKLNNFETSEPDFVDQMGDKWKEYHIVHHGLLKWQEITGEKDVKKSPYWGATANSIDWIASVDLQAAAQTSIDHSISKTCNLPENVSQELVGQAYMRAWETGCKGFTIYRDKCRSGVLVSLDDTGDATGGRPSDIKYVMAPKRPLELTCEIKKAKIQGEQWTILVGIFNGKPYEIFGGLSKYIDIPNKFKTGKLIKNGKVNGISTYNLILGEGDDPMNIKDIASVFENSNFGAFTRTISLALRHGVPIQYIAEQMLKDQHSDITSFAKVIARVLKTYIKDGTKSTLERTCPQCNQSNSFVYQEKCLLCSNCGYSRC